MSPVICHLSGEDSYFINVNHNLASTRPPKMPAPSYRVSFTFANRGLHVKDNLLYAKGV